MRIESVMGDNKRLEEKLNHMEFAGCESVLVGDTLHYSLQNNRTFINGVKDLFVIFRLFFMNDCCFRVLGEGSTLTLFSHSFFGRRDHQIAFRNITSSLMDRVGVEYGKRYWSIRIFSDFSCVFSWNRQLRSIGIAFPIRIFLLRELYQCYRDYQDIMEFCEGKDITIKNVLVYCDVLPVDSFVVQKFKAKGAVTATFQHGTFALENNAWAYRASKSDYFLADSNASRDDAIEAGFQGRILVVGTPFQYTTQTERIENSGYRDRESAGMKNSVCGIVMNSVEDPIEDNREMLVTLQSYCKKKGMDILIKYHPSDNQRRYSEVLDKTVVQKEYASELPIQSFLKMVDIVVISKSTVFRTALKMKKLCFIFVRKQHDQNKFRNTDFLKFSNEEELDCLLEQKKEDILEKLEELNSYHNVTEDVNTLYKKAYEEMGMK